jgi:hypothetical protein
MRGGMAWRRRGGAQRIVHGTRRLAGLERYRRKSERHRKYYRDEPTQHRHRV